MEVLQKLFKRHQPKPQKHGLKVVNKLEPWGWEGHSSLGNNNCGPHRRGPPWRCHEADADASLQREAQLAEALSAELSEFWERLPDTGLLSKNKRPHTKPSVRQSLCIPMRDPGNRAGSVHNARNKGESSEKRLGQLRDPSDK